jgi:hypothetical protein
LPGECRGRQLVLQGWKRARVVAQKAQSARERPLIFAGGELEDLLRVRSRD